VSERITVIANDLRDK